jgi:hypothetical protein
LSPLEEICEALRSHWGHSREGRADWLEGAITDIVDKGMFGRVLDQFIDDQSATAQLSTRSFFHPTGATKLIMTNLGRDMPELRVHFWPNVSGLVGNELSIHNHRWDFASHVIFGKLIHEKFVEQDSGYAYSAVEFVERPETKVYESRILGPLRLKNVDHEILATGHRYSMDRNTLHRMTNVWNNLAATLFLRSPYLSDRTIVCHDRADAILTGRYPAGIELDETLRLLALLKEGPVR